MILRSCLPWVASGSSMSKARTPTTRRRPAVEGLTDRQVVAMIEVLSRQLSEYVNEWERRRTETPPDGTHGG